MKLPACRLPSLALLFLASYSLITAVAADTSPKLEKPCTVHSTATGSYFDLRVISLSPPEMKDGQKVHKDDRSESWRAKGYDYPANFTMNICAPVIEKVEDVVGVDKSRWQNVSAFYELDGKVYSIGEQASEPFFRGRRLVLNYTNGSPCPSDSEKRSLDGDGDIKAERGLSTRSSRTKSTIMSFLCDRDSLSAQALISFVGTMDSCTYFFEVRSSAACGGVASAPGEGLGPAGVFGVIVLIAIAVYLVGGCAYQRTVMHQRGWRQCPNYSMWAGMVDFLKDTCIIIFSSLTSCFRQRHTSGGGGYIRVNDSNRQRGGIIGAIGGRGRGADQGRGNRVDVDEENRLIDQLDEEWDD
ncbi:Mannose-6-phosphate receptor binding domain containing protein [Elaphomyces granulatus]